MVAISLRKRAGAPNSPMDVGSHWNFPFQAVVNAVSAQVLRKQYFQLRTGAETNFWSHLTSETRPR